jgi:PncC family amidohydrolase
LQLEIDAALSYRQVVRIMAIETHAVNMNSNSHDLLVRVRSELVRRQLTISCAESVSVGHIQAMLGAPSQASHCFEGGITVYNLEQKVGLLGVDREHAASCDCVSERVVAELAQGALRLFGSDLALSTTGYAEAYPDAGIDQPFAYLGFARAGEEPELRRIDLPTAQRRENQLFVAEMAIATLADWLFPPE